MFFCVLLYFLYFFLLFLFLSIVLMICYKGSLPVGWLFQDLWQSGTLFHASLYLLGRASSAHFVLLVAPRIRNRIRRKKMVLVRFVISHFVIFYVDTDFDFSFVTKNILRSNLQIILSRRQNVK